MKKRLARVKGEFNWVIEEPELLKYSVDIAELWLERELKDKGHVTGDLLNKACGIMAEEIFSAELNELNVPHIRTIPLLAKNHPVNHGKPFDVKIVSSTIDIKSISPYPPRSGHHSNLNVNKAEIENVGKCDFYIATKCYPELLAEAQPIKNKEWVITILNKIERIEFLGYATTEELIKENNLRLYQPSPFYSLKPPFHLMAEFAYKLKIPLELKSAPD